MQAGHKKPQDENIMVCPFPILECGPVPNVMAALPYIGGALCSMPQSLADAHYTVTPEWEFFTFKGGPPPSFSCYRCNVPSQY